MVNYKLRPFCLFSSIARIAEDRYRKKQLNLLRLQPPFFVVFLISLLSISCSQDIEVTKIDSYFDRRISFDQFTSETNVKNVKSGLRVSDFAVLQYAARGESLNEFYIDTTSITKYTNEFDKTTYAFAVVLKIPDYADKRYNLVYRRVGNSWEKVIVAFDDEMGDGKTLTNFDVRYDSQEGTLSSASICWETVVVVQCNGSCAEAQLPECDGFACYNGQCLRTITRLVLCPNIVRTIAPSQLLGGQFDGGGSAGGGGSTGGGGNIDSQNTATTSPPTNSNTENPPAEANSDIDKSFDFEPNPIVPILPPLLDSSVVDPCLVMT